MARFLCKVFWRWADSGWSEVYPISATDYTTCDGTFKAIISDRAAILAPDVTLLAAVISDTDIKGDSFLSTTTTTVGTWAGADTTSFNPNWALRTLWNAGALKRGSRFIHALPNAQVSAVGAFAPTGPFTTAIAAWETAMLGGVSMATRIKGATTAPFYTFTGLTAVANKNMEERKVGRPFGLPRGRRLIA